MATISFAKNPAKQAAPPVEENNLTPVPATASGGAVEMPRENYAPNVTGEVTARDMSLPRLQIGQKSGKLCDDHPEWFGGFVYDKGVFFGKDVRCIVIGMHKFYTEKLPEGSKDIPRNFATAAQAAAAGCDFREAAHLDVLVECNDDMADFAVLFGPDNKGYAPARWTVQSTAFGRTFGIILRDLQGWLKGDLASGFYKFSTEKKSNDINTWWIPVTKTDGKVPAELREEIRAKFGI
jgi:hypothetical protein